MGGGKLPGKVEAAGNREGAKRKADGQDDLEAFHVSARDKGERQLRKLP